MFCLEILNLPFGLQPCYFRLPLCFIHISSVQAAKVKSSRPDVFDPSDVLMRSLTLTKACVPPLCLLFHSFNPRWLFSICFHNIRLQHISIRGSVSVRAQQPGVVVKEAGCSHHHMRLNGPVCESFRSVSFFFLLPVLGVSSSPSLSDCCSCGAEPPAVTRPEGQPASFSEKERKKKKKKKRGVKINFSLNKFVKAASKGVQHLLWHSCPAWCDLENATRHLTNSVAWLLRKKVLFCLTLDW